MAAVEVQEILDVVPQLVKLPHARLWTSYDKEADVLYISFKKPSHADDSELTDDDTIVRYEKGEIVGITVLNASKRARKHARRASNTSVSYTSEAQATPLSGLVKEDKMEPVACWHHGDLKWLLYHLGHNRIDLHGASQRTAKGTYRLHFWLAKMHLKAGERIRIVHKRQIVAEATIDSPTPYTLMPDQCRPGWESAVKLRDIRLRKPHVPVKCPGTGFGSHRLDGATRRLMNKSAKTDKAEELESLANAIRQKNEADAEIARIIERPAERGHAGEYLAAAVFDIEPEPSASNKGIDGRFTSGDLAGRTVNIKWYGKRENILDMSTESGPDFYLVMTGPKSVSMSSRGGSRPWLISCVFLFDSMELLQELRNVKLGTAASVREELWEKAEIYPTQRNSRLVLAAEQKESLRLFDRA